MIRFGISFIFFHIWCNVLCVGVSQNVLFWMCVLSVNELTSSPCLPPLYTHYVVTDHYVSKVVPPKLGNHNIFLTNSWPTLKCIFPNFFFVKDGLNGKPIDNVEYSPLVWYRSACSVDHAAAREGLRSQNTVGRFPAVLESFSEA